MVFKASHVEKYKENAINPYSLSADILMERFRIELGDKNLGAIIAESRGRKENDDRREEFDRCKQIRTSYQRDFDNIEYLRIEDKKENIIGLQIADLVAYPIGYKLVYPNRMNPAYDVVVEKFRKSWYGVLQGYGLIVVPKNYRDYQILD